MFDTFFNITNIQDKSSFIRDCISNSFKVWCEELDCNVSFSRKKTDKIPDDIIEIAEKSDFSHYVFILRNREDYIEAGIRTNGGPKDYFLWINIKPEKLDYFIDKYHIQAHSI